MELLFVGTGSAFAMKNYQTNFIIRNNGKTLLVDAGGDIRFSLQEQGISYKDIDAVYITHLHADHIGGLEWLAFCTYFDPSAKKLPLYINSKIASDLWNDSLKGGLASIQGKVVTLEDYFDVMKVKLNGKFTWEGLEFSIVQSVHILNGYGIVPSFGFMLVAEEKPVVYYPADTQFNPNQIKTFYGQADIIIQDCETAPFRSGVHAHYDELKTLSDELKEKMYLVHFQDNVLDDFEGWKEKASKDKFKGFLRKGDLLTY